MPWLFTFGWFDEAVMLDKHCLWRASAFSKWFFVYIYVSLSVSFHARNSFKYLNITQIKKVDDPSMLFCAMYFWGIFCYYCMIWTWTRWNKIEFETFCLVESFVTVKSYIFWWTMGAIEMSNIIHNWPTSRRKKVSVNYMKCDLLFKCTYLNIHHITIWYPIWNLPPAKPIHASLDCFSRRVPSRYSTKHWLQPDACFGCPKNEYWTLG